MRTIITNSEIETKNLARDIASKVDKNTVIG